MEMANELFDIPIVTKPEDFASSNLDELSGMTYLSYFLAEDGPGYRATLGWVRDQVKPTPVDNFDVSSGGGNDIKLTVLIQAKVGLTVVGF